jgi:predicted PurR-regulated permease PerM
MLLDRIARAIPVGLGRPLSVAAGVLALAGSLLVFAATVYGSWPTVIPGAVAFALAAVCWQLADRMAGRRLRVSK